MTFWGHGCKVDGFGIEHRLPSCKECWKHCLRKIISAEHYESNETDMLLAFEGSEHIHAECHTGNHALQPCNGRKCASWDVLHPSFKFFAPANYPTNYDQRPGAPHPPNRRELNLPIQGTQRMLRAIRLNVK